MKEKTVKRGTRPVKGKSNTKTQGDDIQKQAVQKKDSRENGANQSGPPESSAVTTKLPPPPSAASCAENGVWTGVPDFIPAPDPNSIEKYTLKLEEVAAPRPNNNAQALTFHATGCSANFDEHTAQQAVAAAMTTQLTDPTSGHINTPAVPASFLYLLGDVVYKPTEQMKYDQGNMYNEQFYTPYSAYNRPIFAVAGNHDGKIHFEDGNPANQSTENVDTPKTALTHFFKNFCSFGIARGSKSPDNAVDNRPAMIQPYIYWRLETGPASIIGLYTNAANGGILDDPTATPDLSDPNYAQSAPQYRWLVSQLKDIRARNEARQKQGQEPKAVLLTVHYPPYSYTANFAVRGDPKRALIVNPKNLTPPPHADHAALLSNVLEKAFDAARQWPDVLLSAHVHSYQRLTRHYALKGDTRQMPCLIVGSGGHTIEGMGTPCDQPEGAGEVFLTPTGKAPATIQMQPPPGQMTGGPLTLEDYNDAKFGFLRVTIAQRKLTGEYFTAHTGPLKCVDQFTLDLNAHELI